MTNKLRLFLIVKLVTVFSVLAWANIDDAEYIVPVAANEIKIMSYNVHNLFDAEHDNEKNDYEFLPKDHPQKQKCYEDKNKSRADRCARLDWTTAKVSLKIAQVKQVVNAQGVLPDILVLSEVENKTVVADLAAELGFDAFAMTNSPDKRGIDVAVVFRKEKMTAVKFEERKLTGTNYPTRNLSVMIFQLSPALGGGLLAVFGNHWPSQSPSNGDGRIIAATQLREYVDDIRARYSGKGKELSIILTGDFNVIEGESPHPLNDYILDKNWNVGMKDIRTLAKNARHPLLSKMPRATYYYGVENAWNELDRFFVDSTLTDKRGLDVDPLSYRIHAPSFATKKNKAGELIPFRYNHFSNHPDYVGYSDHFGIVMKLRYRK